MRRRAWLFTDVIELIFNFTSPAAVTFATLVKVGHPRRLRACVYRTQSLLSLLHQTLPQSRFLNALSSDIVNVQSAKDYLVGSLTLGDPAKLAISRLSHEEDHHQVYE